MVDLAPPDVARCQGQVPTEEERNCQLSAADKLNRDWLAPANVSRCDPYLEPRRVEAARPEFHANPVSNQRIVFTALAGHARANRCSGLLADPNMNQAAELDDAQQNRQQHEGDGQHGLECFLTALPIAVGSAQEAWVSRCTI